MKKLLITATLLLLLSLKPLFAGVADGVDVKEVQTLLTKLCLNAGPIDGLWGKKTEKAAKEFLASRSKEYSGTFEKKHAVILRGAVDTKAHQDSFGHAAPQLCEIEHKESSNLCPSYTNKYDEVFNYGLNFEMPEKPSPKPNIATQLFYLAKYLNEKCKVLAFKVNPSIKFRELKRDVRTAPYIKKQLNETALLSYLLFENNNLVVDEITPKTRFGSLVTNETPLLANSVGKSFTSYLLGHAICSGIIKDVNESLSDWPLVQGTMYENKTLIELLNMRAGAQEFVKSADVLVPERKNINHLSIIQWQQRLKGTKPSHPFYNYNNLAPRLVTNYIDFKTGHKYRDFVTNFLQNKVGIEHPVYFIANDRMSLNEHTKSLGIYRTQIHASRHDYLRIAVSMLEDWQTNSCEGKYLKEIYTKRQLKDNPDKVFQKDLRAHNWHNYSYNGYGGFFHTDLFNAERGRKILAMDGFGGQMIVIDFDKGRIVVTNAIYNNFNWKKIVLDVIK